MGSLSFPLYILGFFAFASAVIYAVLVKTLLGVRLKQADCELRELSELPPYLRELFDAYGGRLLNLGFTFSHCQLADEPILTAHSRRWNLVYCNASTDSYANVSMAAAPDRDFPAKVEFLTFFADGHQLLTVNGLAHDIIGRIPGVTLCDKYVESMEKQYEFHLLQLAELKRERTTVRVDARGYVEMDKATANRYIACLESDGLIRKDPDQGYRLTILAALRHAVKTFMGKSRANALRSKTRRHMKTHGLKPVDIPVEVEVTAFLRMKELMQSKNRGYVGSIAVCLVSLIVSMVIFKMTFDIGTAVVIIVALGIHELGHFAGMRMFGQKNLHVLFLPFGAATIGSGEDRCSAMQRVVIYLLGPVPGLILGTCLVCLYQVYAVPFLRELGLFLLILNYVNLIPVLPLDGGRIVDLALFSHCQVLKVLFLGFSVFLLGLAGLFARDAILIALSVALAVSIVPQIRKSMLLAKVKSILREKGIALTDEAIASEVFALMKEGTAAKLSFTQKFQIAKGLLSEVTRKPATVGVSVFAMCIYGAAFLTPLIVAVVWGISVGLIGGGSDYSKGIISFEPSSCGKYVFVTRAKNFITNRGVVLDKNGHLVVELKENIGFTSPNLTWRAGDDGYWVTYRKGGLARAMSRSPGFDELTLRNIATGEEKTTSHPRADSRDCVIGYVAWSSDGRYLFGTETALSEDEAVDKSIFRLDVTTGEISEAKTQKAGRLVSVHRFLPDRNIAVICDEYAEDSESQRFSILDLTSLETKTFELSEQVGQWDIVASSGVLIYFEKVFEDNMVGHQLITRDLETAEQKVLIAADALPKYSFEDAAKNKQLYLSFTLSPTGKWAVWRANGGKQDCACWLVSVASGNSLELLKYNEKEHYVGFMFSASETRLCAIHSGGYDYRGDEPKKTMVEFYDIAGTSPKRISYLECEQQLHTGKFLGDEQFLYIRFDADDSLLNNTSQLWAINVEDGSEEPFIAPGSSR